MEPTSGYLGMVGADHPWYQQPTLGQACCFVHQEVIKTSAIFEDRLRPAVWLRPCGCLDLWMPSWAKLGVLAYMKLSAVNICMILMILHDEVSGRVQELPQHNRSPQNPAQASSICLACLAAVFASPFLGFARAMKRKAEGPPVEADEVELKVLSMDGSSMKTKVSASMPGIWGISLKRSKVRSSSLWDFYLSNFDLFLKPDINYTYIIIHIYIMFHQKSLSLSLSSYYSI